MSDAVVSQTQTGQAREKTQATLSAAGEGIFWSFLCLGLISIFISFGFYPLNDDFALQQTVQRWINEHHLRFSDFIAFSFFWQAVWGRLFSFRVFSSRALVFSTLAAGVIGFVAFRLLLRYRGVSSNLAYIAVISLCFNPYIFTFLFTFMSDVHYLSWLLVATLLYYLGLRAMSPRLLAIATLSSIAAFMVRQNGILIGAAAIIALCATSLVSPKSSQKFQLKLLITMAAVLLFAFLAFREYYLNKLGPTPSFVLMSLDLRSYLVNGFFLKTAPASTLKMLLFLGFATLPLLPVSLAGLTWNRRTTVVFLGSLAGLVLAVVTAVDYVRALGPLAQAIPVGSFFGYPARELPIGSALLIMLGSPPPFFSHRTVISVGVASLVAAAVLITLAVQLLSSHRKWFLSVLFWIPVLQACFAIFMPYMYSRYYYPLVPFAILLVVSPWFDGRRPSAGSLSISVLLAVGFIMFSFWPELRLLSDNEAIWKTASALVQKGIPAKEVEAGFAWDSWHFFEYTNLHSDEIVSHGEKEPWWLQGMTAVMSPEYLLTNSLTPPDAFGPISDSVEVPSRSLPVVGSDRLYLYQVQPKPPLQATSSIIDIAHGQYENQLLKGWWGEEMSSGGHFRWTTHDCTALLRVLPRSAYVRIRGYAILQDRPEISIALSVDGHRIGEHRIAQNGFFEDSFPIDSDLRSKQQIVVDIAVSPAFRVPIDEREHGVIISYVGLEDAKSEVYVTKPRSSN